MLTTKNANQKVPVPTFRLMMSGKPGGYRGGTFYYFSHYRVNIEVAAGAHDEECHPGRCHPRSD